MIEWLATGLSLLGYVFNVRKSVWGFAIWIVANSIWVYVGISKGMWGLVFTMSAYTVMSVWGIYSWLKK